MFNARMYNDLMNNQMNFMKNWMDAAQNMQQNWSPNAADTPTDTPNGNTTPDWTTYQQQFMKSWMDTMEKMQQNATEGPVKQSSEMFNQWWQGQMDFMKNWMEATQNMQQNYANMMQSNPFGGGQTHPVFALYQSWLNSVGSTFNEMVHHFQKGISKDTFTNFFSSTDAYMKLFEFWLPIYKSMTENKFDPEKFKDMFDPERYQELIKKTFSFISPENVKIFYDQATAMLETMTDVNEGSMKRLNDLMNQNAKLYSELAGGNPEAAMKMYKNIADAYQKAMDPMIRMTDLKQSDKFELIFTIMEEYATYVAKYGRFQQLLSESGYEAMQRVIDELGKKVAKGEKIKSYDAFFAHWVETNEKVFEKLMKGEKFSKLQAEMAEAGLKLKMDFEKLMEMAFEGYPIVFRSEVDELHKTIHDLKTQVRDLEKKLKTKTAPKASKTSKK